MGVDTPAKRVWFVYDLFSPAKIESLSGHTGI